VRLGSAVSSVESRAKGTRWSVMTDTGELEADGLVLAVHVPALQSILCASTELAADAAFARSIDELGVTLPFAVWRLFLDRPANGERHPFVGTAGRGILDNISLFERFEGESRRWAMRTGGSVVELHAYAVRHSDTEAIKRDLLGGLHALYPELAESKILHDTWLWRQDCPSFGPGSHASRPRVATPYGNVVLAGDFVRLPFPTALMERATTSGMLAANHLLDRWDVRGEALYSIPPRGFMASLPLR
jgi:isorenieratene synthase